MSVDQVSIVNSALFNLGSPKISSIDEDNERAKAAKAIYDQTRDQVQASHPWVFTKKRVTLAPNATTPEHEFDYTYDYPNDLLTLWEVIPHDVLYVCEKDGIVTDESSLDVVYGSKNTDESAWDPLFCEAISWKLSEKLCMLLLQNVALLQYCAKRFEEVLAQARWRDGTQDRLLQLEATTWTDARR